MAFIALKKYLFIKIGLHSELFFITVEMLKKNNNFTTSSQRIIDIRKTKNTI